jgi:putative ABC transport system substrate-binding protein
MASKPAKKIYRVGILSALDIFYSTADGFKDKMTELGYIEGKDISYEIVKTNVSVGNQKTLQKFVDDKVDLILAFPTEAALEAKSLVKNTNIPIVFAHGILEGTSLVKSIKQPGDNITGVRFPGVEISLKRLELLHEIAPQAKRIFVPYMQDYPSMSTQIDVLRQSATASGMTLQEVPFVGPAEFQNYLEIKDKAADIGMDAILQPSEPFAGIESVVTMVAKFGIEHKIPVASAMSVAGEDNPLVIYAPDSYEVGGLAAQQADRIFKGIPAGTLPVLSPELHLTIDYKVAQKLGLTIPEDLLSQASKIIH